MKKGIAAFLVVLALMFAALPNAAALSYDELYDLVVDEFKSETPNSAKDEQASLSFDEVIEAVKKSFSQISGGYLKLLARLLAVILISAFAGVFFGGSESADEAISVASSLCVFTAVSEHLIQAVDGIAEFAQSFRTISASFIPAFAGIAASCGQVSAATAYSTLCLAAVNMISMLLTDVVVPLTGVLFAVSVAAALSRRAGLNELVGGITKFLKIIISAAGVIFGITSSLQTLVLGATDTAAVSAGRFFVGTAVPIVGSKIAESMGTVFGSLKVMKSTVGAGGIISIAVLCAPMLVRYICLALVLWVSTAASKLLCVNETDLLFTGIRNTVDILIASVSICFVIVAFSSAVLINAGGT